jgi:hypothetical protein
MAQAGWRIRPTGPATAAVLREFARRDDLDRILLGMGNK